MSCVKQKRGAVTAYYPGFCLAFGTDHAAGREALGFEPDSAAVAATEAGGACPAPEDRAEPHDGAQGAMSVRSAMTREGTKQAALVEMLKRAEGGTIDEIVTATGWKPHTVRGALASALEKRLGLAMNAGEGRGAGPGLPDRRLIPATVAGIGGGGQAAAPVAAFTTLRRRRCDPWSSCGNCAGRW